MIIVLTNTRPTLISNTNPLRTRILIQLQSQNVDGNNTGRVNVAAGYQPESSVSGPNAGLVMTQGAFVHKKEEDGTLTKVWKGPIWARSSVNNQSLLVEEDVKDVEPQE